MFLRLCWPFDFIEQLSSVPMI